jgi:Aromatic-ring-opening dioxygenase LigAB, LigA subunit
MSKYQVDKVMREVVMDGKVASAYRENTEKFLEGRELTAEEKKALIDVDYATLYRLGAHPFLLNGFTRLVWKGDKAALNAEYRKNIAPFGYPDFAT